MIDGRRRGVVSTPRAGNRVACHGAGDRSSEDNFFMRTVTGFALFLALSGIALTFNPVSAQDAARVIAGGGISVPGWAGKIDANEEKMGQVLNNAKLAPEGKGMRVTTGPATTYWNPDNKASGNYTVKATFTEPLYMNLNNHPHPYGIVIAGSDLGMPTQSYLYCAAY